MAYAKFVGGKVLDLFVNIVFSCGTYLKFFETFLPTIASLS